MNPDTRDAELLQPPRILEGSERIAERSDLPTITDARHNLSRILKQGRREVSRPERRSVDANPIDTLAADRACARVEPGLRPDCRAAAPDPPGESSNDS